MDKNKFLSILEKYNLNKLIDKARWKIENKILKINFLSPTKTLVGFIETQFPYPDMNMGIYFTNQLINLVNITEGDLDIDISSQKILIKDKIFKLSYSLSDINLIEKIEYVNEPKTIIATIDLSKEKHFIKNFIKAKKALSDNSILTISFRQEDENKLAKFVIGDSNSYANKISFELLTDFFPHVYIDLKFDADLIKTILLSNIDAESIKLDVWEEGLMKISTLEKDIKTTYYLTALEEL